MVSSKSVTVAFGDAKWSAACLFRYTVIYSVTFAAWGNDTPLVRWQMFHLHACFNHAGCHSGETYVETKVEKYDTGKKNKTVGKTMDFRDVFQDSRLCCRPSGFPRPTRSLNHTAEGETVTASLKTLVKYEINISPKITLTRSSSYSKRSRSA